MSVLATRNKKDKEDRSDNDEEDGDVTFDQTPVRVVCPHCGLNVITFIEHESSWVTYAVSIVLLLMLNWAALCVVPVVYPLFKDVVHHCPRCLSVLATRSRVALPSFKQEVMSFRFGSCVIVLARKYVLMLLALTTIIGGIHFVRSSGPPATGVEALHKGELVSLGWEDFIKDCGFKSYLGNPIHVTMAFNEFYKNKTFHWQGSFHHVEEGLSFLWWSQHGAVFARMTPPQFPSKRDIPDLMLLYTEGTPVSSEVQKLKRGMEISFEATMVEVGRRGTPHVMVLWELHSLPTETLHAPETKRAVKKSPAAIADTSGSGEQQPAPMAAGEKQNATASDDRKP